MWAIQGKQGKKLPLYKQVIAVIEQAIESGQLGRGERLPSERQLCDQLQVARSTVVHALQDLTDRGVLLRRQGSGTYVNPEKWGLQQYPILNWQPHTALHAQHGSGDYASQVSRYAEEARRSGRPWQNLSGSYLAGDLLPAIPLPEHSWQDVLRQELDGESSLTGLIQFKDVVREHLMRSLSLHVDPEQILITSGAQQALFLITQCLLRPGDAIGIEAPSYFYSLPVFQAAGLRLFAIPTDNDGILLDGLDAIIARRGLKMIFLNPMFQNPTGHVMSVKRRKEVLQYCSARRIPIVEDDAYSLLPFTPSVGIAPIKSLDDHEQVLYIGSLSSYVGKNIRAGWLVAPKSTVRKLAGVRQQIDADLSVLPQLLACHYLQTAVREHVSLLRKKLAGKAAALQERLNSVLPEAFTFLAPKGGFYLYLRGVNNERGNRPHDFLGMLLGQGIVPALGSECGDADDTFRLNYAHFQY